MQVQAGRALPRVELGELIERTFAPFVGETLARASMRAQLARLGIEGPTLTIEQLEQLLDALEKGLRVFVGSAKAAELIEAVRTEALQGGPR